MLLSTDGTVTHILEAYADEPVDVVKLLQEIDSTDTVHPELELVDDDKVLRRHVLLRGRRSGRTLLYAEAVVALGRVEAGFLDGLLETDKPIGILLAEHRTETFREILHVDRELAGAVGAHFGLPAHARLVSRTYRIMRGRRPMILITEKFPPAHFRDIPA